MRLREHGAFYKDQLGHLCACQEHVNNQLLQVLLGMHFSFHASRQHVKYLHGGR